MGIEIIFLFRYYVQYLIMIRGSSSPVLPTFFRTRTFLPAESTEDAIAHVHEARKDAVLLQFGRFGAADSGVAFDIVQGGRATFGQVRFWRRQ